MGMEAWAARAAGGRRSLRDSLLFRVGGGVDRGGADGVGRGRLSGFGRERADAASASGTVGRAATRREARVGGLGACA